jgi:hypothetical protein
MNMYFFLKWARWVVVAAVVTAVLVPASTNAAARKSEAELIAMLESTDHSTVLDALDRLPNWYPNSTKAQPQIQKLLGAKVNAIGVPINLISRKAARALGNYHVTLTWDELQVFLGFIRSHDVDDIMDGLKALRGLKEPPDIEEKIAAEIMPLLKNEEIHIVRDAIRTLGALGNKNSIPAIEPFLKHMNYDVKKDAREAIAAIEKKTAK